MILTRIIVNGAKGNMGRLACTALKNHAAFELVAELGKEDNLASAIHETGAEVVLELTRADCVFENSLTIINQGAHPVIGASGLLESEITELARLCDKKQLGGIIVPNFSIAAVLMMMFSAEAAKYLPAVEIIEAHHPHKRDAPSGTAIKTAHMIALARKKVSNELFVKEVVPGARGGDVKGINIHSIRLPGILAEQQVMFGNRGETLSIIHKSLDRDCFMPGIILACQKVIGLKTLVYGLEHLLSLNLS